MVPSMSYLRRRKHFPAKNAERLSPNFVVCPRNSRNSRNPKSRQLVVHDEWVNIPAAFVIDGGGILRYAHVGTAFNDRATAEELLEALGRLGS